MVSYAILLFCIVVTVAAAAPATPQMKSPRNKTKSRIIPGAYIVEFKADFISRSNINHHDVFYRQMAKGMMPVTSRMNFSSSVFTGASFYLKNENNISTIKKLGLVENIWPIRIHPKPDARIKKVYNVSQIKVTSTSTKGLKDDTFTPNVMGSVDKLHALGYDGTGVVIAIIDTGVDYLHPALGGGFGSRYKFRFGYDFVGDDYDGYNTPVPDSDPFDCEGHGTHVSGTIGSNGPLFLGAAPKATLGMYRVFGCDGSTTTDILIAAYSAAKKAGVHIITASIGGASGWTDDPWAIVISRIVKAGITCVVAAGNDGENGVFYGSSGSSAIGAIAVASIDSVGTPTDGYQGQYLVQGGSKTNFIYLTDFYDFPSKISGYPLYAIELNIPNRVDACSALPSGTPSLSKQIVLVRDTKCQISTQLTNLNKFGAKYVIFYMTKDSSSSFYAFFSGITTGLVSNKQGTLWLTSLKKGLSIKLYFSTYPDSGFIDLPNAETGGKISKFSSWYPTNDLYVKPEIAAPGGNILSTYPTELGSYAILSGTSMATPYIAGVAALYLNAKGVQNKVSPLTLRNSLVATANPVVFNDGWFSYPQLAPVIQQGTGLVNALAAVNSVTQLSVSSLAFNDTTYFKKSLSFTITNTGTRTISYSLSHKPAPTTNTLYSYTPMALSFPPDLITQYASVRISPSTVTLGCKAKTTITVALTIPKDLETQRVPVYSGYITINGNNSEKLLVPYAGVGCAMKSISVTDVDYSPPSLTYFDSSTYDSGSVSKNQLIRFSKVTLTFSFSLNMPSPLVRLDILGSGAQTNVLGVNILGSVADFPVYSLPRNSNFEATEITWNGTLSTGVKVPAGSYRILYRALKLFGDRNNAKDYESWQSPSFKIAY